MYRNTMYSLYKYLSGYRIATETVACGIIKVLKTHNNDAFHVFRERKSHH